MAYEWKDKIVLITGAATSIGAALTRILMEENAKHVAVLDINEQAGIALQNELNAKYGTKVKFYKCDVTNDELLDHIFKSVVEDQGYLDVVVNNAGIMNDSRQTYRKMIDINVSAEYYPRNGVRVLAMCFGATDTPLLHLNNLGNFDKTMESRFADILKKRPFQKLESAAQGIVDAFKQAESGSTWLAINDKPVENITPTINKAYGLMTSHVL